MWNERPEHLVERQNPNWRVTDWQRRSACANRPGLKKFYVTVVNVEGEPLADAKVRFDTEPSSGLAYDHPNVWGLTDENGYLEWDHYSFPTVYRLFMGDDQMPLIDNIRTDLGNEYCGEISRYHPGNWRPINRPGVYSYDIKIRRRW